ncbi:pentapeptide repeat-containing protein [Candidatus Woesearchaeota archaeon]|nr:pentapeptide repeat-containing protein [Candidatus Woesearchaeota archaeon]
MVTQSAPVAVSLDDFIDAVTEGNRDFSRTRLSGNLSGRPRYPDLQRYLIKKPNLDVLSFEGADLSGLVAQRLYLPFMNAQGANMREADFSDAILCNARFYKADLCGAKLRGTALGFAVLDDADIMRADLTDANLAEATLFRASLSRAVLVHADLTKAKLSGAKLYDAVLRFATLRDACLSGAKLDSADLRYALLENTDIRGASLGHRTDLWASANCIGMRIDEEQKPFFDDALAIRGGAYLVG